MYIKCQLPWGNASTVVAVQMKSKYNISPGDYDGFCSEVCSDSTYLIVMTAVVLN
jgi:hypothetical protein